MLNLVYITGGLAPFDIGGPATVANALIRQFIKMKRLKVNLIVLTSGSKNEIESMFGSKLGNVTRLSLEQPMSYYIRKMRKVWKALDCCQLVHINDFYTVRNFYFPIYAFLRGKPIVYSYHGWISDDIRRLFVGKRFCSLKTEIVNKFFNIEKKFWSVVVVNSESSKKFAIEHEGFSEEKIRVIPHGFDREGIEKADKLDLDGEVKLLYTGMLRRAKRVDLILKAVFLLDPAIKKKIRLYIAGGGPWEKKYEELVARLNIKEYVKFLGRLPLDECYKLYKSCDIYVSAAGESFGMSVLEALGSGMPVVAVNLGAIHELVKNNRNGFLVRPSASEIAQKIKFLTDNSEAYLQIRKNNKRDGKKYSWSKVASKYLNLYESLIK